MNNIVLFDFDGIYKSQDFYLGENYKWMYLQKIIGTNGYCDTYAQDALREKTRDIQLPEISFIGSGNYHYLSLFLTEKINEDFTLVLFDNHTDTQKPIYDELLSCGSWVRTAYFSENHLKQIILIGTSNTYLDAMDDSLKSKISIYPYSIIERNSDWYKQLNLIIKYPIYISIDKDVFCEDEVITNWDQGILNMDRFIKIFDMITNHHRMIGMDVCGEAKVDFVHPVAFEMRNKLNSNINKQLLTLGKKVIA